MIKQSAILIFIYSLIISAVLFFTKGYPSAISCMAGGSLMLINLLGLSFIWGQIFSKKSTALAALTILLKYLGLGLLLWAFSSFSWMEPIGFILGLSTLILSILSMTAVKSFVRKSA